MARPGSRRLFSIMATSLEPIMTPSAPASAMVLACSGVLTPKPTQTGTSVTLFS